MKNSIKTGFFLLAFGSVCAIAGILFAPEEGAKTRKKISKKGKKIWKNAKGTAEDIYAKSENVKDKVLKQSEKLFS